MKEVVYNKQVLEILKELSDGLLKSLLLKKDGDKISLKMKAPSIYVDVSIPSQNFNFHGEEIAFFDGVYDQFYKFFDCFKNPTIAQDQHNFVLKEGKNSIKFRVSDPELIEEKDLFKGLKKLPESVVKISLDRDTFVSIGKMIKMIKTKDVSFNVSGKKVVVTVANENTKNSYDFEIDLDDSTKQDIELSIKSTIFECAPQLDYEVNITEAGLFHFKSTNENFELNLYTGLKG